VAGISGSLPAVVWTWQSGKQKFCQEKCYVCLAPDFECQQRKRQFPNSHGFDMTSKYINMIAILGK
jgi:hypothetical protein